MDRSGLHACHCCGLAQICPPPGLGRRAVCVRCRTPLTDRRHARAKNQLAAGAALAALLLYPLGIGLPVLITERFGHSRATSIWTGVKELMADGQWLIGGVVLLCSIVLPAAKLLGLLALIHLPERLGPQRLRARLWKTIEWVGRWGMLDVLLVALLVASLKLGDLVAVHAGQGLVAFVAMVAASLLASAWFDPHALWDLPASAAPKASRSPTESP